MSIEANVWEINQHIANACERAGRSVNDVIVVAVTKTVDASSIENAFKAGIRHFGENRVQEATLKIEQLKGLRNNVTWHMIGHLQTNKAKTAANLFDIIHSVDSFKLAEILNNCSRGKKPVLIQVNTTSQSTKRGFPIIELSEAVKRIAQMQNLSIIGLMTIAPWVDDAELVRPVFRQLRQLRDALGLQHLSMGMTNDYEVAIEEGATILRIGRAIFGERPYQR